MSLVITNHKGGELAWHIGEPINDIGKHVRNTRHITATHKELAEIERLFPQFMPAIHRGAVRWHGDMGKTILDHLWSEQSLLPRQ